MLDLFRTRATAVSAEVLQVPSPAQAVETVATILAREAVADEPGGRAVWCEGSICQGALDRDALSRRFPGLGFDPTPARAAEARVGVSEFDWALADTGTLAQDATDHRLRLVSTLVETHVALFRREHLLPDLGALLARVDPRRARYLACVTGPSRTADIERVLTIGVHGPRKLVVVVVG